LVVSFGQTIAPHSAVSPVGTESSAALQGRYGTESVKPSPMNSIISKAVAEGAGVASTQRTNLRELAQRIQKDSSTVGTAALYDRFGEMPELDKSELPEIFEFLEALSEFSGEEAGSEKLAGHQKEDEIGQARREGGAKEQGLTSATRLAVGERGAKGGDDSAGEEGGDGEHNFEAGIYKALGKFDKDGTKAAAAAIARGYFEGKEGADPKFLSALSKVSLAFEDVFSEELLAQRAAVEQAKFAAATLETDPATVRLRYRKRLRESRNLGELFEELRELGLEAHFLLLFAEIGRDLASISRDSDKDFLRSLTKELSKLWQLRTSHEESKEAVVNIEPHLLPSEKKIDPLQVTTDFLHFCSKSAVTPTDTQTLLGPLRSASPASQAVFANLLRDLHLRLPDGIWPSPKERFLQYSALGALCHRLTEAEERYYEGSVNSA
jgi:hypothetical protein